MSFFVRFIDSPPTDPQPIPGHLKSEEEEEEKHAPENHQRNAPTEGVLRQRNPPSLTEGVLLSASEHGTPLDESFDIEEPSTLNQKEPKKVIHISKGIPKPFKMDVSPSDYQDDDVTHIKETPDLDDLVRQSIKREIFYPEFDPRFFPIGGYNINGFFSGFPAFGYFDVNTLSEQ